MSASLRPGENEPPGLSRRSANEPPGLSRRSAATGATPSGKLAWQIDKACDRFEKAWKAAGPKGQKRPSVEKHLGSLQGPSRLALLAELVGLDLAYRRKLGEQPAPDEYRKRFPDAGDGLASLFEELTLPPAKPAVQKPAPHADQPAIPGYELLSVLGRGGMGVVYKARQAKLKRLVALKVILAGEYAGPQLLARFRTEAEAVARLQHPHIVQLHEFGEHGGKPYFTLEFMEGGSLDGWLGGTPVAARLAAAIVRALADAMHYAHQHGVVHRDLKPANVLLTAQGLPKITDFGLAKQLDQQTRQTQTGAILGTPSYMAPEQAEGARNIGPHTDVYALGAILYEMLTGRPPFRGATPFDTVLMVVAEEPVPPGNLNPKCPRDLETICLKCLRKEPGQRYASAMQLAEDLRRFAVGEPVAARPVSAGERLLKWAWRRPAAAALVVFAALTLLVLLAGGLWFGQHERRLRGQADEARQDAVTKAEAEARARCEAQLHVARLAMARGQALCEAGDFSRGTLWLAHSLQSAPEGTFPFEQAVRTHLGFCRQSLRPLKLCLDRQGELAAFSPDGQMIASVSGTTVHLWNAASGQPVEPSLQHPGGLRAMAFSPDGQTLATGGNDRTVRFWKTATGEQLGKPRETRDDFRCLAFCPDGKSMVVGFGATVQRWRVPAGEVVFTFDLPREWLDSVRSLACSADGKTILLGSGKGHFSLRNAETGKVMRESWQQGGVLAVAFSPDGKTFVTASDHQKAQVWKLATASPDGPPLRHAGKVSAAAFSPEGRVLLTGSEDGTACLWDTATGQPRGAPLMHPAAVRTAAFSRDGKTILTACADGRVRLWEAAAGQPRWRTACGHIVALAFHPTGKNFVTTINDSNVAYPVWDTATGKQVGKPLPVNEGGHFVAYSPDGKRLVTGHPTGARLWNADTRQQIGPILHQGVAIRAVAFSPDGKMVLTAGNDRTARRWDTTGRSLGEVLRHNDTVLALAFSRDGKTILTGSWDKTVRLWEAATGRPLGEPLSLGEGVVSVAFSPDGRTVLAGGRTGTARLWETVSGQPLGLPMKHQANVRAVAFSPDGRTVATASEDRTARLWDAATGRPLCPPLEHRGEVTLMAFSPDGRTLMTAGDDQTARLWDAVTGQPVSPPLHHQAAVIAAAFSPNGKTLLAGTYSFGERFEAELCLWRVPPAVEGSVERLVLWAQVLTGLELDDKEEIHALRADSWQKRRQRLDELGGPPLP